MPEDCGLKCKPEPNWVLLFVFATPLYSLLLLSKVYVLAYLSVIIFLAFYAKRLPRNLLVVTGFFLFIWGGVEFAINPYDSSVVQFAKLFIFISFVLSALALTNRVRLTNNQIFLCVYLPIFFFIFINFAHIFRNTMVGDLWLLPFSGNLTSSAAYKIESAGIFFGAENKNIWATKVLLPSLLFWVLGGERFSDKKFIKYSGRFFLLFFVLYTFSRTAQIALLAFLCLYYYQVLRCIPSRFVKYVLYVIYLSSAIFVIAFFIDKILHFSFDPSDGFYSRTILWKAAFNRDWIDYFIGNGFGYGRILIPEKTVLVNDNFHNVFINQFVDLGLLGVLLYILFWFFWVKEVTGGRYLSLSYIWAPVFLVCSSHYTGFDNDLAFYFFSVLILKSSLRIRRRVNDQAYLN